MVHSRHVQMYSSFAAIIIGYVFLFMIYYLQKSASLDHKQWDMNTMTVADFTIQMTIPPEVWKLWNSECQFGSHCTKSFKDFFRKQIQQQVNEMPRIFKYRKDQPQPQV